MFFFVALIEDSLVWVRHHLQGPSPPHTHMATSAVPWLWILMVWTRRIYWKKKRRRMVMKRTQKWPRCTTTTPIPTHTLTTPRCTHGGCYYEVLNRRLHPAWATWRAQWQDPWSTDGDLPLRRIMSLQGGLVQSVHQMAPSSQTRTLLKRLLQLQSIQDSGYQNTPIHKARMWEELQVNSASSTIAIILENICLKCIDFFFFSQHVNTK